MKFRKCNHCGEERSVEDFYVRKDGSLNPWCRTCYRAWYVRRSGGLVVRACDWCGVEMSVTRRRASESLVFHSRKCKESHRKEEEKRQRLAAKPIRWCAHCGNELPKSMRSDARFCGRECNDAAHAQWRKMGKRTGKTIKFSRFSIAHRDNWRCGICGGKISQHKTHPDPGCLSIDHIVPVSEGGNNEPHNLRAVHLRCNLSRRDRGGNEQLLLA